MTNGPDLLLFGPERNGAASHAGGGTKPPTS
jgi:hypothetical protein